MVCIGAEYFQVRTDQRHPDIEIIHDGSKPVFKLLQGIGCFFGKGDIFIDSAISFEPAVLVQDGESRGLNADPVSIFTQRPGFMIEKSFFP